MSGPDLPHGPDVQPDDARPTSADAGDPALSGAAPASVSGTLTDALGDLVSLVPRPRRRMLVPDARYERRPSDVVRLGIAAVLLLIVVLITRSRGDLEGSFGRFVLSLPPWLTSAFELVQASGTTFVLGILLLLVLAHRRWRLALAVVVATAVATVAVLLLYAWLDPGAQVPADVEDIRSFPLRRLAVSVAIFLSLRAYLVRPVRRVFDAIVVATVLSSMLTPVGLPLDVVAGLLVGWGAASATSLLLGSPAGQPTVDEVRYALVEIQDARRESTSAFRPTAPGCGSWCSR